MKEELLKRTESRISSENKAGLLLAISDTSELNYSSKRGRIKDQQKVGPIGNEKNLGYFIHPTLMVDFSSNTVLGIGNYFSWNRPKEKCLKHRDLRPLSEKESSRWLDEAKGLMNRYAKQKEQLCFVYDREGDIYNTLTEIDAQGSKYVIRSKHDRRVLDEEYSGLKETIENGAFNKFEYELEVKGNNRQKRIAKLEVQYGRIVLKRPKRKATQGLVKKLEVGFVQITEKRETVPKGEQAINWRLFSNLAIENQEDALIVIQIYVLRWLIEELFRILKTKGLKIEDLALENSENIRKMAILSIETATKVLQLKQAGRNPEIELRAEGVFDQSQTMALKRIASKVEGKTKKQQNPFKLNSLAWAYWIIGRLGGWDGYMPRPPGVIALVKGISKLAVIVQFNLE